MVVPKGTFLSGAIFLKQGVNLQIEKDGVLKGTTYMADYKLVQTRWEGEERIWVSALVNVFDVNGFHLTGPGTIDGSGDRVARSDESRRQRRDDAARGCRSGACRSASVGAQRRLIGGA